ncbi:MAG: hypothetical protein EAZ99_04205 [Alphaproteobacteria bacterium]|nr:MAG: hypothetical protein EAZ99_04205 [Alphaproteobacteria bacterium]
MSLYFDSVANSNETITGSAGNDVFQLNISGTGANTINTGAGNDVVLGLGRAPAIIIDERGADTYQFINRVTDISNFSGAVIEVRNFDSDDVVQIPSAANPGQPRLFSSFSSASNNLGAGGIAGARESGAVGFYVDTSGDGIADYAVSFITSYGAARFATNFTTINGISFVEVRLRTGAVTDTPDVVYRFFNTQTGGQFLTTSEAERESLLNGLQNMNFEGTGFRVLETAATGTVPVYRFNNLTTGGHLFTTSDAERAALASNRNFRAEGIGFYADPDGGTGTLPVYRFFDTRTGGHMFTTSEAERQAILVGQPHLSPEGIGFWTPA